MGCAALSYNDTNGNPVHAVPTITMQTDGKGYEVHHVRVEDGRVDAVLTVRVESDPAVLVIPNVNQGETGLIGNDGRLTILNYSYTG